MTWLIVIFTVLAAALVGVLPGALPLEVVLGICAAGILVLAVVVFRRMLPGSSTPATAAVGDSDHAPAVVEEHQAPEDRDLRFTRFLFYLGVLTVAESSWRFSFGLTVSELFFIAAFAGCAFSVLRGHSIARVPAALVAGVCIFAFGAAISSVSAASPTESGTEVLHAVYVMLLWVWTGAMLLRNRPQIMIAVTLWAISTAVSGFGALTQVFGIEALAGEMEGSRATGFTVHPNDLGGACAIALVPALLLATRWVPERAPIIRALNWVVVALVAVGLVLSGSMAALLAGFVGIVVWLSSPFVRAPGRVAVVAAMAVTLLVVAIAGGRITTPLERLEQVTSPAGSGPVAGSGEERLEITKRAWPTIRENPIIGQGVDPAGTVVTILSGGRPVVYQVHGAPVAAWYEAGIFGLIGVLIVFAALVATGWRALSTAGSDDELLIGLGLFAACVAFLIFALTTPFVLQQYGWFSAVMLVAWRLRRDLAPQLSPAILVPDRSPVASAYPRPLPR